MIEMQREIIKLIKKYKPDREQLTHVLREVKRDERVKKIIGPVKKRRPRRLPDVPSDEQIRTLLASMEKQAQLDYRLMVKMLVYTGMRSFELTNLKWTDIDWERNRIKVRGKGDKDRLVPLAKVFRDELLLYRSKNPRNRYVFESRLNDKYSERYIRKVFQDACKRAECGRIHPHSLRHYFITYWTNQGWPDREVQLMSGHESRSSLQIYQHLGLPGIEEKFQQNAGGMV